MTIQPDDVFTLLDETARQQGLNVRGGSIRRSSSRFCLGVEHGDYNGTELFGVGTDRFIWLAYKPNDSRRVRLYSHNVSHEGVIEFQLGTAPPSAAVADSWARFPLGVDTILRRAGYPCDVGFDGVLYGNIPGGGMSRSASLSLNLILTFLSLAKHDDLPGMRIVELAQAVENDYIGSPCGNLDQIMIYFARAGMGTHYRPRQNSIEHLPLGPSADDFRMLSLDTGTDRPGLEKSTYKIRREECQRLVELARPEFGIECLADVQSDRQYEKLCAAFGASQPALCRRLKYIYQAQQRFEHMLTAWRAGDVRQVGRIFREDGIGLRDDYEISGPELETMCDIVRTVDGVLGERMLGGGDKGAAGALVLASAVDEVSAAVDRAYRRSRPALSDAFAVHTCQTVDGMVELPGL